MSGLSRKWKTGSKVRPKLKSSFAVARVGGDYGIDGFDLKWIDYRQKVADAKDQHKSTPALPQELQPMLCEESGRKFLSSLTGQKYPTLEDMKAGMEFLLFQLR